MMRTIQRAVASSVVLLLATATTQAGLITIGDFSGSETVIDFDGLETGSPFENEDGDVIASQFAAQGVTFHNPNPGLDIFAEYQFLFASPAAYVEQGGGRSGLLAPLEIHFNVAVNRIGLDIVNPSLGSVFTLSVFDEFGGLIESTTLATNVETFLGLETTLDVAKATLINVRGDHTLNFFIDDVRFESTVSAVPEPNTGVLLGLCGLGIAALRRRMPKTVQ